MRFIYGFFAGALIGVLMWINFYTYNDTYEFIWDKERNGLRKLNDVMEHDDSSRLALIVITSKGKYGITSLKDKNLFIDANIFQKGGV